MKRLDRRQFLRGAGGITVGLPLLTSLLPKSARAQAPRPNKRFFVFFHPNGVIPQNWWPTAGAGEADFTLANSHAAALGPLKDKLIYLKGVDLLTGKQGPGERHQTGMGTMLTGMPLLQGTFVGGDGSLAGWGSSISVDQKIAQFVGQQSAIPSLQLGIRASGAEVRHRLSYLGPAQPLPPQNDPQAVWDRLFSDFMTDPVQLEKMRRQRKSVLDAVIEQFDAVNNRMDRHDQVKLDNHLELVRDLERRIEQLPTSPGACTPPTRPAAREIDSEDTMPEIAQLMVDLAVMATACDLTRVISLQFSNAENHIRFPWVNSLGDGHALSHSGPSDAEAATQLSIRDTWYAQQFARLLSGLKAIDEPAGNVLDQSVAFYCNELSIGNTHSHVEMPFIVAGSGGGYFRTGRMLQFDHASHCNLLVSFLNAMGMEDRVFGMPQFCTGPLAGLV